MENKGETAMNQIQKSRVANGAILINAGAILVSEAAAILLVEGA